MWIIFKERWKKFIFLFVILCFAAKEFVANDYEIVIIYCLLMFIILNYFIFKRSLNRTFITIIKNIQQEYKLLSRIIDLLLIQISEVIQFCYKVYNLLTKLHVLLFSYYKKIVISSLKGNPEFTLKAINIITLKNKVNFENRKKLALYYINIINNNYL